VEIHGALPADIDDGTIAPTAAGGSIAFAPEIVVLRLLGPLGLLGFVRRR
jgi:hypothetical protein